MLTVHAVFPAKGTSKAYVHEVVVRPTEDGGVQYVSNHVIHSKEDYEKTWHKPRLTVEERERLEKGYGFPSGEAEERERLEKGYDLPVTEEEKQEAKRDLEKMMELAGKADLSAGGENVYGRIISDEAMLSMKARNWKRFCWIASWENAEPPCCTRFAGTGQSCGKNFIMTGVTCTSCRHARRGTRKGR